MQKRKDGMIRVLGAPPRTPEEWKMDGEALLRLLLILTMVAVWTAVLVDILFLEGG